MTGTRRGQRAAQNAFMVAALVGVVHGLFSLYWGAGGTWLLETLGERLVQSFADKRWVLLPVGLVKVGCAVAPMVLARAGWPWRPLTRTVTWLGAGVLIAWGGLSAVVAHLVLGGVIRPHGYDRLGMIGHAWLWDPMFVVWGAALAVGLVASRERR